MARIEPISAEETQGRARELLTELVQRGGEPGPMVRCDGERAGVAARLSRPVAGDEARPHRPSHHGVAILLDAFVVVLRLLGDLAWWMPGSLARRVPRIALEPTEVKA